MKKRLLIIISIYCLFLIGSNIKEKTTTFITYQREKIEIESRDNTMKLEIPDWNWERIVKPGTIDHIDESFATLLQGNENNLIIAGHDRNIIFHDLHKLKTGMKVIFYRNSLKTSYQVSSILVVNPTEVKYLEETTNSKLTLITCTQDDQKRLIIICNKTI